MSPQVAVLCGGLGGSRMAHALALALGPGRVTAIGNVGDDLEFLGLRVSPDLDTILYTLGGLLDEERGWGVRDETYSALAQAERLGEETWFTLGDRDLGLHLARTRRLAAGESLSAVTDGLCRALGIPASILPVTDDRLRTIVLTDEGELDFQTWFVRRRHADPVRAVRYEGADDAAPAPGVLEALLEAELVVVAPSNPYVSIGPILAVPGVMETLRERRETVVAVSPIVGGKALRGPLVGMLETLGSEPSAAGVAALYEYVAGVFVVDRVDAGLAPRVAERGLRPVVCDTVMLDPAGRADVGRQLLEEVGR
ncbi:MAG: 2-phospho-L-lactate transferase [Gaiellales bacterium]